ncbi:hypothetical protein HMPREF1982_00484 [Clostridiales bacterium oral taxon 876 str. F0540]|nr:hypothetical protein HMPREF1982_00484 [Clostridiales bacterium oral taxon 876 str. F0540]
MGNGEVKVMGSGFGIFGAVSFLSILEEILKVLTYIVVISLGFKAMKALNIYINKNTK